MSAKIIDGKKIANEIKAELKNEVEKLRSEGIFPHLATLLVGDNLASKIYLKNKHTACKEIGIESTNLELPENSTTEQVCRKLQELNCDDKIHAILVQLPLPQQVDTKLVLASIGPKDVDGLGPLFFSQIFAAKDISELNNSEIPFVIPPTPAGIMILLQSTGCSLAGRNVLVIGRSVIVGKPCAALLLAHHATATIAHSQTKNLADYSKGADILIAAIGKPKFITGEMLKEGAIVIDVGINRDDKGKLCGDVDFESAKEKAGWITPVPGGVGPMTIAMLLKNTIQLAKFHAKGKMMLIRKILKLDWREIA